MQEPCNYRCNKMPKLNSAKADDEKNRNKTDMTLKILKHAQEIIFDAQAGIKGKHKMENNQGHTMGKKKHNIECERK